MGKVIEHKSPINSFTGQPIAAPSLEFFFPVLADSLAGRSQLPTGFELMVSEEPDNVVDRFSQSEFLNPTSESLLPIASTLAEFKPTSLVSFDDHWYLRCCRGSVDKYEAGSQILLQDCSSPEEVASWFEGFDVEDIDVLSFYQTYGGMRESLPQASGNFLYGDLVFVSDHPMSRYMDEDDLSGWEDSVCLYTARNGDVLLVSEEGETAWVSIERQEVIPFTDSFSNFILFWASHVRSDKGRPFDSFSSHEDA